MRRFMRGKMKKIHISVIILAAILLSFLLPSVINYLGIRQNIILKLESMQTWAGHEFKVIKYNDVEFTNDGYMVGSNSHAKSKLIDVNVNRKIKIRVIADIEGKLESGEENKNCVTPECIRGHSYNFAEFAIYFADQSRIFENRYGIATLGTRHRIVAGNDRDEFNFTEFTIENTGDSIIFSDNSGETFTLDKNTQTEHSLEKLNKDETWNLHINSHVNGEGFTRIKIKDIVVEEL